MSKGKLVRGILYVFMIIWMLLLGVFILQRLFFLWSSGIYVFSEGLINYPRYSIAEFSEKVAQTGEREDFLNNNIDYMAPENPPGSVPYKYYLLKGNVFVLNYYGRLRLCDIYGREYKEVVGQGDVND